MITNLTPQITKEGSQITLILCLFMICVLFQSMIPMQQKNKVRRDEFGKA